MSLSFSCLLAFKPQKLGSSVILGCSRLPVSWEGTRKMGFARWTDVSVQRGLWSSRHFWPSVVTWLNNLHSRDNMSSFQSLMKTVRYCRKLRLQIFQTLWQEYLFNMEFHKIFYFPSTCGLCFSLSFPRKFVTVSLFAVVSTEEILENSICYVCFFHYFSSGRNEK